MPRIDGVVAGGGGVDDDDAAVRVVGQGVGAGGAKQYTKNRYRYRCAKYHFWPPSWKTIEFLITV